MRKIIALICVAVSLIALLTGCKKSSADLSDPKNLILGTWVVAQEGKGDELYETDRDETLVFHANGVLEMDQDHFVWLLQGQYLFIDDNAHYVKSLAKNELIFTEKEDPDGAYFICERLEQGDPDFNVPDDFDTQIIGRWYNPKFGEDYYIEFNSAGNGVTVKESYGAVTFSWKIFDGNRLRIVYDHSRLDTELLIIDECNVDILQIFDTQLIRLY